MLAAVGGANGMGTNASRHNLFTKKVKSKVSMVVPSCVYNSSRLQTLLFLVVWVVLLFMCAFVPALVTYQAKQHILCTYCAPASIAIGKKYAF